MICPRCGSSCLPYHSEVPTFTPWRPVFMSQVHHLVCRCGHRWDAVRVIVLAPEPDPCDVIPEPLLESEPLPESAEMVATAEAFVKGDGR